MPKKRLYDHEAKALGLDLKKPKKGRKQGEYYLNAERVEMLKELRSEDIDNKTETKPNNYNEPKPFVLNAFSPSGKMMDIDTYCETYGLPRKDIRSHKLVTHTGVPYYNIVFGESIEGDEDQTEQIKNILKREIKKTYRYVEPRVYTENLSTVLKWSDLHFGAFIRDLILTPDYDSSILENKLNYSVDKVNKRGFKKTHIHINGDLIESFTGLNHMNSWMSLNKNEVGAKAIKLCSLMFDRVFKRVHNLGCIKIVAGNHDRLSKSNDEDVKGGAAELIAFSLELMGYDVEFDPMIITHEVDGICHINLHGHLGISKRSTESIILNYGNPKMFNLICEGHLHSLIEKLSIKQRSAFKMVKDDSINFRRMHLHSFFPGNFYSESLGFLTNTGFSIFNDNGFGKPEHQDVPI